MTMSDQTTYATDTRYATDARADLSRTRGPAFMPIDVVGFIVMLAMIWGPLAAGAMRQ